MFERAGLSDHKVIQFLQYSPSFAEAQSISKSGQGERRKGRNRRRKWGTEKKNKKNVVIHNLTKHWCSKSTAEEKKMRDTYKHRNKQSARLAVLTANNKINKTCREKVNGCQDRQEDVPYHTTAREANTLKE